MKIHWLKRKGGLQLCTENTVFRNYQKITLQESPGSVEAGRIPRSKVGVWGDCEG